MYTETKKSYLHTGFIHVQANHVAILRELEYKVKITEVSEPIHR
jgi:hypothetical protein